MFNVGDVSSIRKELTSDRNWRNGTRSININDSLLISALRMLVLELDTGEPIERGVADCSCVSCSLTLTEEVFGILFTNSSMFTRIGITSVCHLTTVNDHIFIHDLIS